MRPAAGSVLVLVSYSGREGGRATQQAASSERVARLLPCIGVMLTRHTQVENLANLLVVRRKGTLAHTYRHEAYRGLVATILNVPIDTVAMTPLREPTPVPLRGAARRIQAA